MSNTKTCGCCATSKNFTQYYKSPIDGSYVALCKNCCRKKFKKYLQIVNNDSAALWLVLAELGIPYLTDVWDKTDLALTNAGNNTDVVMLYLKTLNESGIVVNGFWESDKMLDQLIETNVDRDSDKEDIDWEEEFRKWGRFTDDDGNTDEEAYDFLNRTFDDYTGDMLEMDTNLEKRYRDLAKAELRKRRADESGDIGEIAKAQDNLKKILDMLKLSDFQNNKETEIDKHIERIAWTIENTKPAECKDLDKYKDFSKFGIKWKELLRCIQNLLAGTREYPDIPKGEE